MRWRLLTPTLHSLRRRQTPRGQVARSPRRLPRQQLRRESRKSLGSTSVVQKDYARLLRVADSDIVFSWFALGFAAVANAAACLLGRASIVISGGWDVTRLPEIGYGRLLTPRGTLVAKMAVSSADQVLAFSSWSERAIRALAPNCTVDTAPRGVDVDKFGPNA